ncbi:MAG: phosphoribosyl-AMP cyclohydrolase [Spirochaetaceae bacterium]
MRRAFVMQLRYNDDGLIPAVVTDHASGEVLMLAYMNEEAFRKTLETREGWYFSRSRNELWHKGETSGNTQRVHEVLVDCDEDTVWLRVEQRGGAACHTGFRSCFYRRVLVDTDGRIQTEQRIEHPTVDPQELYGSSGE